MIRSFFRKYYIPLAIFIGSRILIVFVIFIANGFPLGDGQLTLNRWDSINYISIAENGYQFSGEYKGTGALIAFYPLLPILVGFMNSVTHLGYLYSGILLSTIFALGSIVLLYRLVSDWKGEEASKMAVILLSFYPSSVFLSSVYTESLFLFLTLATLYLLEHKKEKLGTITVALACITRMTGSILGLIFAWEIWQKTKSIFKFLLYCFLAGIPFFVFLYFQYTYYGTPFASMLAQHTNWSQYAIFPWRGLWAVLDRAFFADSYVVMWRTDLVYLIVMITTLVLSFKTIPRRIWIFGLGVVLLTLCSNFILGMGRYMMLVLPFYFYWGYLLSTRKFASYLVLTVFACLMTATTILFSLSKSVF